MFVKRSGENELICGQISKKKVSREQPLIHTTYSPDPEWCDFLLFPSLASSERFVYAEVIKTEA